MLYIFCRISSSPAHARHPTTGTASSDSSASSSSASSSSNPSLLLPSDPSARAGLFSSLDVPSHSDWRALLPGLGLERFAAYFAARDSPSEAALTLWEAQV